jgi:signal transduction histidine kinase
MPFEATDKISSRPGRQSRRSIRFRLTALFVMILGVTLIAFSVTLYGAFVRTHRTEFDAALYNHAVDVADSIEVNLFGQLTLSGELLSRNEKIFPFAVGRALLQIVSPSGQVLAKSAAVAETGLPIYRDDLAKLAVESAVFRDLAVEEVPERGRAARATYRLLTYRVRNMRKPEFLLQIAVPMTFLEQESRNLRLFFLIGIPFTLLVATFGGIYLSGRALMPVLDIIEKARNITARNLDERLPIPSANDELQALSLTLNDLLDRLHRAFEGQERFVSDASHELKTPLAILRGELDLMRSRSRTPEETSAFLASASQELDQLSRLVEDLLLLARMDAGAGSMARRPLRLDEVVLEVVARTQRMAKARGIKVRFDLSGGEDASEFCVLGDSNLLHSLLHNLIENAVKFSPDEATVTVKMTSQANEVVTTVIDEGPGIPPDEQTRIFDRFFRAEGAREKTSGMGLGLAIARRIAEAHEAKLWVESELGRGSRFYFSIKKI